MSKSKQNWRMLFHIKKFPLLKEEGGEGEILFLKGILQDLTLYHPFLDWKILL